ncbi:MAG: DUF4192 domain-containing protein [Mycobacteriaceae bacterium]|nr:DUF4192 domain-containing protein [Mycobacteriaceae bacterium]
MTINLKTNADIVANIAPLLGFVPTNSIVIYLLRDDDDELIIRAVGRLDAALPETTVQAAITDLRLDPDEVNATILVAVCAEWLDHHAGQLLDTISAAITGAGIRVLKRLHTRQVEHGGQWTDVDTGDSGPTYPFRDSIAAAESVHRGRVITASRADLEHEFNMTDAAPPIEVGDHGELVIATFTHIAEVMAGHREISPTLAAQAGIVITESKDLRDRLLSLTGEQPRQGARLWTTIAAMLRGAPRVEALVLAGINHYAAGDAIRAGIALEAARDTAIETGCRFSQLAQLMHGAVRAGIPPERIRDVIASVDATPPPPNDSDDS